MELASSLKNTLLPLFLHKFINLKLLRFIIIFWRFDSLNTFSVHWYMFFFNSCHLAKISLRSFLVELITMKCDWGFNCSFSKAIWTFKSLFFNSFGSDCECVFSFRQKCEIWKCKKINFSWIVMKKSLKDLLTSLRKCHSGSSFHRCDFSDVYLDRNVWWRMLRGIFCNSKAEIRKKNYLMIAKKIVG